MSKESMYRAALFCATATCFFLPLYSPLLSAFSSLTIFFWIFSGRIIDCPAVIKRNSIVFLATLLFFLFIIGIFYSSSTLLYSFEILKKYRELIYFPILFSLFYTLPRESLAKCEKSFLAGCILLLAISYCMYFSILPSYKYGNSIVFHITHSFFMAILAYFSLQYAINAKKYRIFWSCIALLTIINLFYIAPGRTGMLIFLCLALLMLIQHLRFVYMVIGIIIFSLLTLSVFYTSQNFSDRTDKAYLEIKDYHYGNARTSQGQRLDWWITSLRLIKERPIFGHGTGSYKTEHIRETKGTKIKETDNPHNEYLFIAEQLGLVGFLLYLGIFAAEFIFSFRLEKRDRYCLQGVVLAMAIGCLMNSFLFDSHQGHFWAFLSTILIAKENRPSTKKGKTVHEKIAQINS